MAETIKTTAIVLKSSKHNVDAARLLVLFSPEKGRFSAVIRGVEKPKAKLASASQPFCFGEYMLAEKNGFYTVTDCYIYDSFYSLASNLDNYVLSSAMLEITSKLAVEDDSNVELFTLLLNCLRMVAYEKAEPTAVTIKFLKQALVLSGFGMDMSTCDVCGQKLKADEDVGLVYLGSGMVCEKDKGKVDHVDLSYEEWQTLHAIDETKVDELSHLKFHSREALTSCLGLMLKQFYFRTGEKLVSLTKYF